MRQLLLPFYEPFFPAPERAVLTLLNAALSVTEHAMRDAHPLVCIAVGEPQREQGEEVLRCAAGLISDAVSNCASSSKCMTVFLIALVPSMMKRSHSDVPSRYAFGDGPPIFSIDALVFFDHGTLDFRDHAHSRP